MDTIEADSKMSLWGEFDVVKDPSEGNFAPPPNIHPVPNVQSNPKPSSVSEKVETLSAKCNSKKDLFTHLLRQVLSMG